MCVNAEFVRQMLKSQPFVPFVARMTNGDSHEVRHPEMAMLAGSRLIVHDPNGDRLAILSLLHIASLEVLQPA